MKPPVVAPKNMDAWIFQQLRGAILQSHPDNADQIATMIYESTKETNDARELLRDPVRLQQKVAEAVALLARNQ